MNPETPGNSPNENQNNNFVEPTKNPNASASDPNAFTALTDKVGDGIVTQSLNSADLPKKFAKWNAIKGMLAAVTVFLAGIVIAAVSYNKNHSHKDLLIIIAD